ncbi:P-loop containing nucleoside triphosphate hydrolase isoform A [Chlorella sorokiniana]|uniref:P-loop containing nucleoside triphosphate hydrolase isoform A n=1 Tax=Chlorella sorokiniana TaxID=3076 RepID=A0A2P6TGB4_CHLSO|nr:P-loop containing nucleoside triphosphate hydrolase isoform A [Chlorella sorokiniana]|eukprot:PRW33164.1 P-loop containing nucleoside triphosphate hydrolase isoform A [Chlorella sorokiniana]
MKPTTVLLLLAAAAAASCRPMPFARRILLEALPPDQAQALCDVSAHDQCISETQYCQGTTLNICGAGLRCNFNEQAIGCEPVDSQSTNPCEDSAHDQCLNETSYCKGKTLNICGTGLRCNFNEQAIGCEPADAQPANPCEDSAHDQCLNETSYCKGTTLNICGAGLRCNFNEQAIGCEPVDSQSTNPCEDSAHDQCLNETSYCKGKTLNICGTGLRCNFNEQAIGCEPADAQPANPCEDSAHDQCLNETSYCKGTTLNICGAGLRCNFNEQDIGCEPVDAQPANPCEDSAHDQCLNETSYCKGTTLNICGAGLRCNFNEQDIGCEPVDAQPANPCEDSAHDQCLDETSYCKGTTLNICGTGLRCNFNEQAIGCEPRHSAAMLTSATAARRPSAAAPTTAAATAARRRPCGPARLRPRVLRTCQAQAAGSSDGSTSSPSQQPAAAAAAGAAAEDQARFVMQRGTDGSFQKLQRVPCLQLQTWLEQQQGLPAKQAAEAAWQLALAFQSEQAALAGLPAAFAFCRSQQMSGPGAAAVLCYIRQGETTTLQRKLGTIAAAAGLSAGQARELALKMPSMLTAAGEETMQEAGAWLQQYFPTSEELWPVLERGPMLLAAPAARLQRNADYLHAPPFGWDSEAIAAYIERFPQGFSTGDFRSEKTEPKLLFLSEVVGVSRVELIELHSNYLKYGLATMTASYVLLRERAPGRLLKDDGGISMQFVRGDAVRMAEWCDMELRDVRWHLREWPRRGEGRPLLEELRQGSTAGWKPLLGQLDEQARLAAKQSGSSGPALRLAVAETSNEQKRCAMGGIKNRDAKRAANKVFSSGGGGGSKGPAVVDKRGQELPCPHCDRIFKQSDRLKQHIQKQHADLAAAAESEAASSSAAAAAAPAAPKVLAPKAVAAVNAAASAAVKSVAAAAAPGKQQGKAAAGGAGAAGGSGAAAAAAASGPKLMDIGSKAGFYEAKSPKLLLHEWCLREKVPRPRYRPSATEGGLWKCKVVLPHPKKQELDVVVFLDDAQAAPSEEEAEQRAAVAALHRVQGDRALDRILPRPYVVQWKDLEQQHQERQQRAAQAAERQRAAAERQRAAAKRQQPAAVIMADDKRKLVEGIISELQAEAGGSASGSLAAEGTSGGGDGADGWASLDAPAGASAEAAAALTEELVLLGFGQQDAAAAVAAVGSTSGGAPSLSDALDWLCVRLPEDRLPKNFAPGAAGKPVSIIRRADGGSAGNLGPASRGGSFATGLDAAAEAAEAAAAAEGLLEDPAVAELAQYGYPPAEAAAALEQTGGHVQRALAVLHARLAAAATGADGAAAAAAAVEAAAVASSAADEAALEEWHEERTALEAIYGADAAFPSEQHTSLQLPVELTSAAATAAAGGRHELRLQLDFLAPSTAAGGPPYPQAPPVVGLRAEGVPAGALLTLTRQLAQQAAELAGHPMVYELASAATEQLESCLLRPLPLAQLLPAAGGSAAVSRDGSAADLAQQAEQALRLEDIANTVIPAAGPQRRRRQGAAGSGIDIAAESRRLAEQQKKLESGQEHAAMRGVRLRLPAAAKRQEVLSLCASRRVVVVSGATGCGKSTQVPQFLLEQAIAGGSGAACNIICTQPRRISAVGLATRVAAERGEQVGGTVGYSVRLDSKQSARTRLLFCTTGVLLRRLLGDPALTGTTHVVLDEVHERSIESDLLLLLLRGLLESGRNPGLRVVLMSATADAGLFAGYFEAALREPAGQLTIPGFTHPVTDMFLEDALESTGLLIGKVSKWAKRSGGGKQGSSGGGGGGGRADDSSNAAEQDGGGGGGGELRQYSEQTRISLSNIDESLVNTDLIEALVAHLLSTRGQRQQQQEGGGKRRGGGGDDDANAILIFAPGADEISRICRTLSSSGRVAAAAGGGGVQVLPLHGGLPPSQQARVFNRPPKGTVKIVVSTNVAETSITIDDVTAVIDTGRVKEMRFDAARGIARLQETFVSQAAAQQRRGRAGRVRPGVCYRLFSRRTWGRMPRDTPPEIARAPLQALVLDVKGILGAAADVPALLAKMITPPEPKALQQALTSLRLIGALDSATGALTPLGQHLTRMPCDPRIGKMLLYGSLLRCLDPVLTIAAAQGWGRPVFWSTPDKREEAEVARRSVAAAVVVSKSDHLAVVAAYNSWRAVLEKDGRQGAHEFCGRSFLSDQALEAIDAGRQQYAELLADLGFIPASYAAHASAAGGRGRRGGGYSSAVSNPYGEGGERPLHEVDEHSSNARTVKATLCCGFYPQLLRVEHPAAKYTKVHGGAVEIENEPHKIKFFDRERGRVFLHPSSVNFSCGKFESGWLAYSEIVETSKVFVRESSMVPVYAVLLFGGSIEVQHEQGMLRVDGWARFKAPARIAVLVRELRNEVSRLLAAKVADPSLDLSRSRVVEAMHHLLATDGF